MAKKGYFVVSIYCDDFERRIMFACIYCGSTISKTRDHVISVSWRGYGRFYDKGTTVPCCRECNGLLSDKPLFSISSRAEYLITALKRKYKKILRVPSWTKTELKEMQYGLKRNITAYKSLKEFTELRIFHCWLVANSDEIQDCRN